MTNYCTKCCCYFAMPGTCNCYAPKQYNINTPVSGGTVTINPHVTAAPLKYPQGARSAGESWGPTY